MCRSIGLASLCLSLWACTSETSEAESSPPANRAGTVPVAESPPSPPPEPEKSFAERRREFRTELTRKQPAPQSVTKQKPPRGVKELTFTSGNLELKAWLARPKGASKEEKLPAVVYLHGGFAFGRSDFEDLRPFLHAGFIVMTPILRGENGNPGNFEMFLGEVDDAQAALRWLLEQPGLNPERVYLVGHGPGGAIAAMLSLRSDTGLRNSASVGGLFTRAMLAELGEIAPFDIQNPAELEMRSPQGHAEAMQHPHYAYVGSTDRYEERQRHFGSGFGQLHFERIEGDHFSSLAPALELYLTRIQEDEG